MKVKLRVLCLLTKYIRGFSIGYKAVMAVYMCIKLSESHMVSRCLKIGI